MRCDGLRLTAFGFCCCSLRRRTSSRYLKEFLSRGARGFSPEKSHTVSVARPMRKTRNVVVVVVVFCVVVGVFCVVFGLVRLFKRTDLLCGCVF